MNVLIIIPLKKAVWANYIHTYINFIKVSRYLAKKLIVDTINK